MQKPSTEQFTVTELTSQASINQHKKKVTEMPILNVMNKVRKESQENVSVSFNIKQEVLHNSSLYSSYIYPEMDQYTKLKHVTAVVMFSLN
jgi:hypothetical protein